MEEINYGGIDTAKIRHDERLFYLLTSASFVEILSELYTENLVLYYRDDPEASGWLKETWQSEEMQHGRALRAYVRAVWPEFDWDAAYKGFAEEYGAMCTESELEESKALEFAARCIVETGTSTLYRCLHDYATEPVLKQLLANIKADEVRHFSVFLKMFRAYNAREGKNSFAVWGALWRRVLEIRGDDSLVAFRHAWIGRHPGEEFREEDWLRFSKDVGRWARLHYPYHMAVQMLLAPLPTPEFVKKLLAPPLRLTVKLAMF